MMWIKRNLLRLLSAPVIRRLVNRLMLIVSGLLTTAVGLDPELVGPWAAQTEVILTGLVIFVLTGLLEVKAVHKGSK